jgi:mannose-6-phosphate isomerase-like protein (cupin superfamily)
MLMFRKLCQTPPRANSQWLEATRGERMSVRTSADETAGVYAMLEVLAELRNGVRMHIHNNEYEHFLVLKGMLHIANGGEGLDVPAGAAGSVKKRVPQAWCSLADTPVRHADHPLAATHRECSGKWVRAIVMTSLPFLPPQ